MESKTKIPRYAFDRKDQELIRLVNEVLQNPRVARTLYYPYFHPNGIKEMVETRGLRSAFAVAQLLSSLAIGGVEERLNALRSLRLEVIGQSKDNKPAAVQVAGNRATEPSTARPNPRPASIPRWTICRPCGTAASGRWPAGSPARPWPSSAAGRWPWTAWNQPLKLGAGDVYLVYRRSYAQMPSEPDERKEAQEAGVHFLLLNQPVG